MIVVDCIQGSDEWFQAKLGIPGASEFDKIITPAKLEPSRSADGYMNKLLGEWLRGRPDETFKSEWMKRGNELEEQAREWYAFRFDADPQTVGFCKVDDERYGCSPDALIAEDGGLELKCVLSSTLVGYYLDGRLPLEYKMQVVGNLLVTGREWWDFCAWHHDIKPFCLRVERKNILKELQALKDALDKFCDKLEQNKQKLKLKVAA